MRRGIDLVRLDAQMEARWSETVGGPRSRGMEVGFSGMWRNTWSGGVNAPAGGCPRAVSDRVGSRRMLQIIVLACIFIRSGVSPWSDDTLALTGTQPFAGGGDHLDGLVRFIGAADHADAGLDGVVDGHRFPLTHQFFL